MSKRVPPGFAVVRPKDPQLALRLTSEWKKRTYASPRERTEAFNAILHAQPYTWIGFSKDRRTRDVIDWDGNVVDQLQLGDSFVPYEDLVNTGKEYVQ